MIAAKAPVSVEADLTQFTVATISASGRIDGK
jgi:hypothetical protein